MFSQTGLIHVTDGTFSDEAGEKLQASLVNLNNAVGKLDLPAITGAVTLDATAFGHWHKVSGTSADYTVVLPSAASHAGEWIGFIMLPSLTKLVTIDGASSETINGATTRIMWAGESAQLMSDGTNWIKIAGKTIPMSCVLKRSTDQSYSTGTWTSASMGTQVSGLAAMFDSGNGRAKIVRPGAYMCQGFAYLTGSGTTFAYCAIGLNVADNSSGSGIFSQSSAVGGAAVPFVGATFDGCAANDYLALNVYSDGSSPKILGAGGTALCVVEIPTW